jgi:hypothetical protein
LFSGPAKKNFSATICLFDLGKSCDSLIMAVPPPYVLLPPRIGHFGTAVLLPPWSGRYLNEDAGRFLFALPVAPPFFGGQR